METINVDYLHQFISKPVEVSIQDEDGKDRAPFSRKEVNRIELCPDKTHLRIYFDQQKFFAIPLNAKVQIMGDDWLATDMSSQLTYVIRKISES